MTPSLRQVCKGTITSQVKNPGLRLSAILNGESLFKIAESQILFFVLRESALCAQSPGTQLEGYACSQCFVFQRMALRRRPSTSTPSSKWNPWRTKTKIVEAKVTGIGQTASQNNGCSLSAALTTPKIAPRQLPIQTMKSYLVFISFSNTTNKAAASGHSFCKNGLAQRTRMTQRMANDNQFGREIAGFPSSLPIFRATVASLS